MMTQERLKLLVTYNPVTGIFIRNISVSNRVAGTTLGCVDTKGYIKCTLDKRSTYGHRLAFLYMTGAIPEEIDHINGNPSNNIWTNLRAVSRSANQCNSKLHRDTSSGVKGLSYRHRDKVWKACVVWHGKAYQKSVCAPINCETTKQLLTDWVMETRAKLHQEYAKHG